jgi:hypothetical protein
MPTDQILRGRSFPFYFAGLLMAVPLAFGCGKSDDKTSNADEPAKPVAATPDKPEAGSPAAAANGTAKPGETNTSTETPATTSTTPAAEKPAAETPAAPAPKPPVIEDVVRKPATAAEAIATVDLRKLPIPADVEDPSVGPTDVGFQTKEPIKPTFDAVEKFLLDAGCEPYRDRQSYPGSISGGYTKNGFRIDVSASSYESEGKEPSTSIFVRNLGNVNLARLPAPDGAKVWHSFPDTAAFITDAGVEETRKAMHEKLLAAGWQPYGSAGDTRNYKQNATQIDVTINSPPATPGQTVITFGSEQLGADLPAPPTATRVDYSDNPTQVYVEFPGTPNEAVKFNQEALTAAGWKATTDKPIEDGNEQMLIFRNDAKDMVTLKVNGDPEEKGIRYSLEYMTGEEVAKQDEEFKKLIAERKKKQEEEANKPKPKATIFVPAEAKEVEADGMDIEFQVASGGAKAAVAAIIKQLEADGWKVEDTLGEDAGGRTSLKKDDVSISISHIDPGIIPGEVSISGRGVELEKSGN